MRAITETDRGAGVPGHEVAGVVAALGHGTTGLTVGQRVSASPTGRDGSPEDTAAAFAPAIRVTGRTIIQVRPRAGRRPASSAASTPPTSSEAMSRPALGARVTPECITAT